MAAIRAAAPVEDEELARRAVRAVDPRLGLLRAVGDGGHTQLPLRMAVATVADPLGGPDREVVAAGPDPATARVRAVRAGLAAYAGLAVDARLLLGADGRSPLLAGPGDDPRAALADVAAGRRAATVPGFRLPVQGRAGVDGAGADRGAVVAVDARAAFPELGGAGGPVPIAGRDWTDAVEAGLLVHCHRLLLAELTRLGDQAQVDAGPGPGGDGPAWPVLAVDRVRLDPVAAGYRAALADLRLAVTVRDVTGRLAVPAYAFEVDGQVRAYACARRPADAVRDGFEQVLRAAQAELHGEPCCRPAPVPPLPAGWPAAPAVPPRRPVPRSALAAALRAAGELAVVVPLDADPEVTRLVPAVLRVVTVPAGLGTGRLRDAVAAALAGCAEVWPGPPAGVLVAVTDGGDTGGDAAARAAAGGRPWLPVGTEPGRALVGPVEEPGRPGCVECARRRRELAREHKAGWAVLRAERGAELAGPAPLLTGLAAATVAALAAAEALAAAAPGAPADLEPRPPLSRGAVLVIGLADLAVGTHRFLPDPDCPVCGGLPADSPDAARGLRPRSRPKSARGTYRVRAVDLEQLRRTYVDPEVGSVRRLGHRTEAGLAVARAPLGIPGGGPDDAGWGRGRDARGAEAVAVLEALERYAGSRPGGRRTVVRAAYPEVAGHAVDPQSFGLHAPGQRDEPGHRYPPYDETAPRRWVWAWSFRRQEPVLVPESLAYYRTRLTHPEDPPLAFETSNGCAVGSCPEEAVLHGLLEVLERDAFLLTWHARLPAPRLDRAGWADPLARLLAGQIERETGHTVHAFDTTAEHGIPCVWVLAVDQPGGGGPAVACAAGAHLDPVRALRSALTELGPILAQLRRDYPERAARAAELVADPARVTAMEDHSLLHASPAAAHRLDFLLRPDRCPVPRRRDPPEPAADLCEDLLGAVGRVLAAGLDVLAVDLTTAELRAGGLAAAKVLVPGALPMTFGHAHRRLTGLPRLRTVPHRLRYTDRPLVPGEVYTLPHPFP